VLAEIKSEEEEVELGVMFHICNPSIGKGKAEDGMFKANMGYIVRLASENKKMNNSA
jgi:hypothetical protein